MPTNYIHDFANDYFVAFALQNPSYILGLIPKEVHDTALSEI